jgi:hypothetical protein
LARPAATKELEQKQTSVSFSLRFGPVSEGVPHNRIFLFSAHTVQQVPPLPDGFWRHNAAGKPGLNHSQIPVRGLNQNIRVNSRNSRIMIPRLSGRRAFTIQAEVPKSLDLDLDCNMLICNGLSWIA